MKLKVKKSGTGPVVYVPKKWLGLEVEVLLANEINPFLRRKEIEELIEEKIEEAKKGY